MDIEQKWLIQSSISNGFGEAIGRNMDFVKAMQNSLGVRATEAMESNAKVVKAMQNSLGVKATEAMQCNMNLGFAKVIQDSIDFSFMETIRDNIIDQIEALISIVQTIDLSGNIDVIEEELGDLNEQEKAYITKEVVDKINYIFQDNVESTVEERFNEVMGRQKESRTKKEMKALVRSLVYTIVGWIVTTLMATCLLGKDKSNKIILVRSESSIEAPINYGILKNSSFKVLKEEGDWYQVQFEYNEEEVHGWVVKSDIEQR